MASLHTVTEDTKAIFRWGVIGIVLCLVAVVIFRLGMGIKEHFFPTPPVPPTVSFGKLSPIVFPKNVTDKKLTFSLDTLSGNLPSFPDKIVVYPFEKPQPSFLDLQHAQEKATILGFTDPGIPVSETQYMWTEKDLPFRKLFFDLGTFNFTITDNFLADQNLLKDLIGTPDETGAKTAVTGLLTNTELLPTDLDTAKTKTQLLAMQNQQITPASSLSQASLVSVNFFQKDIGGLPIVYPHPPDSTMSFVVVGNTFQQKIVQASFSHYTIDTQTASATYPLKSANQAFKDLQADKGYIASYFGTNQSIRISNIFLAYYMSDKQQNYLMPVVVFEGDNGFFAYVSAVTDAWIQSSSAQK